jgi:transcriptional regulator with XRE-family HTH domain
MSTGVDTASRPTAEPVVPQDWAAVAWALNQRMRELGWTQRELARRSQVSQAIVREIQHRTVERRRSARTLQALSRALGWFPDHLAEILHGQRPPAAPHPASTSNEVVAFLIRIEAGLGVISKRLGALEARFDLIASPPGSAGATT